MLIRIVLTILVFAAATVVIVVYGLPLIDQDHHLGCPRNGCGSSFGEFSSFVLLVTVLPIGAIWAGYTRGPR